MSFTYSHRYVHLLIPARTIEPTTKMAVCMVSVQITAVRPPEKEYIKPHHKRRYISVLFHCLSVKKVTLVAYEK